MQMILHTVKRLCSGLCRIQSLSLNYHFVLRNLIVGADYFLPAAISSSCFFTLADEVEPTDFLASIQLLTAILS